MFAIPKEIISYFDDAKIHHSGTIAFITASVSLIAIIKSSLNTWSLHRKSNLEIQIESNRYNLELFNRRYDALVEFERNIHIAEIMSYPEEQGSIEEKAVLLKKNIDEIDKISLLFPKEENSSLVVFYESTTRIKYLMSNLSFLRNNKDILHREYIAAKNKAQNSSDKKLSIIRDGLYKSFEENRNLFFNRTVEYMTLLGKYNTSKESAIIYIKSKLSVSDKSYHLNKNLFSTCWQFVIKTGPRHERIVIWLVGVICLLFLGVLLCE